MTLELEKFDIIHVKKNSVIKFGNFSIMIVTICNTPVPLSLVSGNKDGSGFRVPRGVLRLKSGSQLVYGMRSIDMEFQT